MAPLHEFTFLLCSWNDGISMTENIKLIWSWQQTINNFGRSLRMLEIVPHKQMHEGGSNYSAAFFKKFISVNIYQNVSDMTFLDNVSFALLMMCQNQSPLKLEERKKYVWCNESSVLLYQGYAFYTVTIFESKSDYNHLLAIIKRYMVWVFFFQQTLTRQAFEQWLQEENS